jgi:hypothetical protein
VYVLAYLVIACTAFFIAMARVLEWWARGGGWTRKAPMPSGPPIERLASDLRRLGNDYSRIESSDLPRRAVRLQSVSLAYDDTLYACCTALEIPEPPRPPFDPVQRLEIEATLAQRGLDW